MEKEGHFEISTEYIYLLIEREFIETNKNIYKLGRTKKINLERFNQYPKQSILLFQIKCLNSVNDETVLKKIFSNKFIKHPEIGSEYFQGNADDMIETIYNYLHKPKQISEKECNNIQEKYKTIKSLIIKPNCIKIRDKELIISITDENEMEFIKSNINNSMGFYLNSLENYLSEKQEVSSTLLEIPQAVSVDENTTVIPLNQFQTFYKEYQAFSIEKLNISSKLRELQKQIEHSEMKTFNEYCGDLFNTKVVSHLCEYCKINRYPTVKSLSAHQRKCKLTKE
jgi:hypothetical protein